ncbi:MAG: hypothetical protein H0V11_08285 [Actinobacteria bacterium]|nr:hypothetical protein [Actinomycetota bacterium]
MAAEPRPAFYALASGGWRDYVTLLHPPYTLWHLSYVAIGAALAPSFEAERLLAALVAFFLGMGVGAHALDELQGRPLQTRIGTGTLVALAALSIAGAVGIGVFAALAWTPWLLPFVAFGAFIVYAYNLELVGGRFHSHFWFALSWGAFPLLAGYLVTAERLTLEAGLAACFAAFFSFAQRQLSTPVRMVRRRVQSVSGTVRFKDGTEEAIDAETLRRVPERALQAMSVAVVAMAASLVVLRLD